MVTKHRGIYDRTGFMLMAGPEYYGPQKTTFENPAVTEL